MEASDLRKFLSTKITVGNFRSGPEVTRSPDFDRVSALPRRVLNIRDPLAAEMWTAKLQRVRTTPCDCANLYPNGCITSFNAMQGWALQEASQVGGLLGSIGVGEGKTSLDIFLAMAIPGVKHAVLLIQIGRAHV